MRKFRFPHQQLAFDELKRNIHQIMARLATLNPAIEDAVKGWRFGPVVDALRALRGIDTTIGTTVTAEIGDIIRFSNPRQLMAWLGLVPSEHSSGTSIRRGRLTKTGNALARTMMVEARVLPPPRPRTAQISQTRSPPAAREPGYRLESSGSTDETLSRSGPNRKTATACAGRCRPGTGGIHLGYRPKNAAQGLTPATFISCSMLETAAKVRESSEYVRMKIRP
ncbi:MAG: transposase [Paracoccaceae bacterium]